MSVGQARRRGDKIIARGTRRGSLPPAGDERREELKRRADDLEEVAESTLPEMGAIDSAKLKVENEIAQLFDSRHRLKITGLQKGYVYKLCSVRQDGQQIDDAKMEGWDIVQGDMPEAIERKGIGGDTTRHFGDCVLLRMRKDHWIAVQKRRKQLKSRLRESIVGPLTELGRITERRFGKNLVHTDLNDPIFKRAVEAGVAAALADRKFDKHLRDGTVPGMEIPE
jgi:hypothetical protein